MKKRKKIPKTLRTTDLDNAGIFFGFKKILCTKYCICKSADVEGNVALFGGTSSGKTTSVVKQTLYRTWKHPFVAIDIKGDLYREYAQLKYCRQTKVISLRGETENTYDPLDFIRRDGKENLVSNIKELANALIPLPLNVQDPFWIESARNLLTAGMLYYYESGIENFIDIAINILTTPPAKLIEEIAYSGNKMARIFVNNLIVESFDPETNEIKYSTFSDSKMLLGISQEITNCLVIFAFDTRVSKTLIPSTDSVSWADDLQTYKIFISVPEDRMEQYGGVLRMMLTQLIRALERRSEMRSPEGKSQRPILLMLDEFARIGRMEIITSAVSTTRSKGITICLIMQSAAQLDAIYGKEIRRIILENCAYQAILNANDVESRRYFSELIGTTLVPKVNYTKNYDNADHVSGYSENISATREPAIYPHEWGTLKKGIVLITPDGYHYVEKAPYYSEAYQNYKSQKPKQNILQRAINFIESIPAKIKSLWSKLKSLA